MTLNVLKSWEMSLCFSYLYSAVIFLMTAATGACLCIWCRDSFTQDHDTIGLVRSSCLITGIVMMLFLASWTVFVSLTISSSGNESTSKCTQTTKKKTQFNKKQKDLDYSFRKIDHDPAVVVQFDRVDQSRVHVVDQLLLGRQVPGDQQLLLQVEELVQECHNPKYDLGHVETECFLS